jgi:hypothetical protein
MSDMSCANCEACCRQGRLSGVKAEGLCTLPEKLFILRARLRSQHV